MVGERILKKLIVKKIINVIIGFAVVVVLFNFISNAISPQKIRERTLKEMQKYDVVEIYIKEGDTAWKIQKKLTPNEPIDKMLYYAEILNNKKMSNIHPGEILKFLKEKNK